MSYFSDAKSEVDKGREGGFLGIPIYFLPRLDEYLGGIQAERVDLIGADSGFGKTSLVDLVYIISPIYSIANGLTDFDYKVDYWSFEISRKRKLIKLASTYLYTRFGLVTPYKKLLSYGKQKNRLSDDLYKAFMKTEEFMDIVERHVRIHDIPTHPTAIAAHTSRYRKKIGKIKWRNVENPKSELLDKNPFKDDPERVGEYEKVYIPDNPKLIHKNITDHVGKILREHEESVVKNPRIVPRLLSTKANLDRHSAYCVYNRNFYGTSSVNISQFNRSLADISRQRFTELRPGKEDFKDTGNMYEDADVVMGGLDPYSYNIKKYLGWDTKKLDGRGRWIFVLKNRDGDSNVDLGLRFIGESAHFCELPIIESDETIDYKSIIDLNNKVIL